VPPSSPIVISADAGRLQQVFWNLLSNAVKFTPQGGAVRVVCLEQDAHVRVEVTDTGQGIPADFLPRVFDRFSQHGDRRHEPRVGLGLGLALVREMVLAHGGTVTADSPGEGRGSTFVVTLPLSLHQGRQTATQRGTGNDAPVESIASLLILVVDDEVDVREVLVLMLESRGAKVQVAASAADALRLVDKMNPDLLLADLGMPGEDGLSLIRKVRAHEAARGNDRLPAIAVTAYASPGDRDQALAAGYDWHIPKPVDPDALLRAIAKVRKSDAV
jgi:CheY-like chemotaxis protein